MTRKEAFFFLTLVTSFLFSLLFLLWDFTNRQRVKTAFREEIISQALTIRDNLKIIETRLLREDIQSFISQLNRDDLKVNLMTQPITKSEFKAKKFPNDQRKWWVVAIPLSLKNFSGQLEVARPFTFQSPPFFIYLFIFFAITIIVAISLLYLSGKTSQRFIFALRGEKEAWQRFLGAKEEIGEIVRIVWEREKRSEELIEKLKDKTENFNLLISSIKDPCFILNEKRSFLYANPSFLKLCGVDEASLLSRSAFNLFLKRERVEKFIDQIFQKGEIDNFEFELDDDFYFAWGKTFSSEKRGVKVVCILTKITEKKRWEKVKQELVTAIGHEIKTPLAAIRGTVETLKQRMKGKNRQFLSIIDSHTERLTNLTNNLLSLSNLEEIEKGVIALNITEVNLKRLLKDIISLFSLAIKKKGLRVKLVLPKDDLVVKGDRYFLEQAFINLLENAVNYTDKGKIEIRLIRGLDYAEIAFSDTGIGIPPDDLARIFERFYVVDKSRSRKTGGSGLGLAIVKHIVNLHQGKIEVKSELGKGSTFTVFLPRA